MSGRTQLILLVGVALALVGWLAWPQIYDYIAPFLRAESWREWRVWIRSFGVLAPVMSVALSVAQIVPLPIPPPALPLANGWLFGVLGGTIVTWIGVVLNAMLGYALARGPGRSLMTRLVPARHMRRAERVVSDHGGWSVFVARLVPILPFSAISVVAGLLHLPVREYAIATAAGVLPSSFALALIGWQLSRGTLAWSHIIIALLILGLLMAASVPLSRQFGNGDDDEKEEAERAPHTQRLGLKPQAERAKPPEGG